MRTGGLAEAIFGAGKSRNLFAYVTVGTGISYCLVQDRRPFRGALGNAITLGSSPLGTACTHCEAKLRPVVEEFASGPAIAKRFAQMREKPDSNARSTEVGSAEQVFHAAANGDCCAIEILTSAGEALGVTRRFS